MSKSAAQESCVTGGDASGVTAPKWEGSGQHLPIENKWYAFGWFQGEIQVLLSLDGPHIYF